MPSSLAGVGRNTPHVSRAERHPHGLELLFVPPPHRKEGLVNNFFLIGILYTNISVKSNPPSPGQTKNSGHVQEFREQPHVGVWRHL